MQPGEPQAPGGPWWRRKLEDVFGLDVRSLALLRIGLGILVLCDVSQRYQDVQAHYSDEGVLPRFLVPAANAVFSLHFIDGSPTFQACLFYIHGFVALMLTLGWMTRYAVPLAWLFTMSVQGRNMLVMHGGDVFLRLALFWGIFLPLGACFSVDSLSRPRPPRRVLSMGSFAFVLQVCMVYWFAGLLKYDPAWRESGYALHMALSVGHFTTPLGYYVLEHHWLTRLLSFATISLEMFGPFLLLIPWKTWFFRLAAFVCFVLFHVGIGVTMSMGIFQPICAVIWLAFLPAEFWDWLGRRLRHPLREGLELHFDPQSRASQESARFWTTVLLTGDLPLVPAGARFSREEVRKEGPWILVDRDGSTHAGTDALRTLFLVSPLFRPLAGLADRNPFRAMARGWARRLSLTGVAKAEPPPRPDAPPAVAPLSGPVNLLIAGLLLYVAAWNINSWQEPHDPDANVVLRTLLRGRDAVSERFPPHLTVLGNTLGLQQGWGLFAPSPGRLHGWLVVVGTLEDGRQVDPARDGEPVNWEKPALISDMFVNSRWRQYQISVMSIAQSDVRVREFYARYLCRTWNAEHPTPGEQMRTIEMYLMREETQPDYQPLTLQRVRLSVTDCRTMTTDLQPILVTP